MFLLEKEFKFEASHQLMLHDGMCANLHGHSWVGRVMVAGESLHTIGPKQGMLVDYTDLKTILEPLVVLHLDHKHLNDSLLTASPTSEYIAEWLFGRIKFQIAELGVRLVAVQIDETCTSRCTYTGTEQAAFPWWADA